MKNILFVCSRNKWRSLTAETIFKNNPNYEVKSAGTENSARIRINANHIIWADTIFVMEKKHHERLLEKFPKEMNNKKIVILEIQDIYKYMDAELIEELKNSLTEYL
ncbi:protein-tyrosine phosphatase [Flavobacterium croceum DSM 17960]|uniref:Protein-tyrosine phosphatase n=1 Tax=Flavobacterium croceum DSM 17960 TaxID=1121886 RepID=A0A2S4N4L3_9FLAO|nr:protein tyrosine phosphatase [Flavobacterium croceum]POS00674.1 protein-tyrosine phosphatase [Flavobacterium croceum DSM 17960]